MSFSAIKKSIIAGCISGAFLFSGALSVTAQEAAPKPEGGHHQHSHGHPHPQAQHPHGHSQHHGKQGHEHPHKANAGEEAHLKSCEEFLAKPVVHPESKRSAKKRAHCTKFVAEHANKGKAHEKIQKKINKCKAFIAKHEAAPAAN